MSQTNLAAARTPAVRIPAPVRAPAPPKLRVVTGGQTRTWPMAAVVFSIAALALGMIALLLLNTARAEQSFALDQLRTNSSALADTEAQLRSELDAVSAPERLALKAQEMGMVQSGQRTYVRASDRKVLGVADAAAPAGGFTVNTLPDTPASAVAAQAVPAAMLSVVYVPQKPKTTEKKADSSASAAPTRPTPSSSVTSPTSPRAAAASGRAPQPQQAQTPGPKSARTTAPPSPTTN